MATAKFSQLEAFNFDTNSVTAYIERVHLFFTANDMPDKKAVTVTIVEKRMNSYETSQPQTLLRPSSYLSLPRF